MLPSLHDEHRRLLLVISLTASCALILLLPLAAQSSMNASDSVPATQTSDQRVTPSIVPLVDHDTPIVIQRDPFVPDDNALAQPGDAAPSVVGMRVRAGDPIGVAPNGGGAAMVRAIILGAHAHALIDVGGIVRVLGVGDALGEATVTAIDRGGVTLSNGSHLSLAERAP